LRALHPDIIAALDDKGATDIEKAALLTFMLNQQASAIGRIDGLATAIDDMVRQQDEAEAEAARLTAMLDKFTVEAPE
jgi:hypothetical protein